LKYLHHWKEDATLFQQETRQWYNAAVTSPTNEPNRDLIHSYPDAHILQTPAWGALKSHHGWSAEHVQDGNQGALLLFRPLPLGMKLAYLPKGPLGGNLPALLPALLTACRRQGAFALKIEPDCWTPDPLEEELTSLGFIRSPHEVQPRRTVVINLNGSEDDILSRMKQKTRYNIRLAGRKGVEVHTWKDVGAFAEMMRITGERDEFGIHSAAYYQDAYDLFHADGACELFVATFEQQPLAALMVFQRGARAWYMYGASTNAHRNLMPTYLLQWEAIRWAKEKGSVEYDLWGVPDEEEATLEANFSNRSDGLWGVYRFKRGFGGDLKRSLGAWDIPLQPVRYRLYRSALKLRQR